MAVGGSQEKGFDDLNGAYKKKKKYNNREKKERKGPSRKKERPPRNVAIDVRAKETMPGTGGAGVRGRETDGKKGQGGTEAGVGEEDAGSRMTRSWGRWIQLLLMLR